MNDHYDEVEGDLEAAEERLLDPERKDDEQEFDFS